MTMRPPVVEEEEEVQLNDDLEQLLWDINEFCGRAADKQDEIPENLETYLKFVAKTGNTVFPWQHVRPLFRKKMSKAISDFGGEPSPTESFIFERFDIFRGAPFTIQRLAELITNPKRHYKVKDKYLRGLEKTVLVVTTIEPSSGSGDDEDNANQEEPMVWMNDSNESENGVSPSGTEPFLVEPPSENTVTVHVNNLNTSIEELQDNNVTIVETVDAIDGVTELQTSAGEAMDEGQGISGTLMPEDMNTSVEEGVEIPLPQAVVIEEVVKDSEAELLDIPTEAVVVAEVVEDVPVEIETTAEEITAAIETVIAPELLSQVAQEAIHAVESVSVEAENLSEQQQPDSGAPEPTVTLVVEEPLVLTEDVAASDPVVEEQTPVSTISDVVPGTQDQDLLPTEVANTSDLSASSELPISGVVTTDEAGDASS